VSLIQAAARRLARHATQGDLALLPILLVAAWERLAHLEQTDWSMDSAAVYQIAQDALIRHAVPVTGILNSINAFGGPAPIYLYLPFVLLRDPIFGAVATALFNIIGVGLTYLFARRYLGYPAAVVCASLFAVAAWPVFFSRYIWQTNLLAPLAVILVMLIASGLVRGRPGWLMWAWPLWGVMAQIHPAALALGGLLVAGWALAPRTVRWRDALVGAALTEVLFLPTQIFEVVNHFYDVHIFLSYSRNHAIINLETVRTYLMLTNLPPWVPWHGSLLYRVIHPLVPVLVAGAMLSAAASVITLAVRGWRASAMSGGLATLWASVRGAIAWAQAPEQAAWRLRLLLVLWPGVLLLSQLRHYSPVYSHYLMTAVPAEFLLVGLLAQDALRVLDAWGSAAWWRLLAWRRAIATMAVGVPLALVITTQLTAAPAQFPELMSYPLGPEKAGLTLARQIAQRDHVTLVVFQPDFFTREAVRYLLNNGYSPGAPAQIVEPDRCLPLPARTHARTLFLFSGPRAYSESVLRALPGVRDLFAGGPAAAYFRAYELTPDELFASLPSVTSSTDPALATVFGGQIGLERLVGVPAVAGSAPRLATLVDFVAPVAPVPFTTVYAVTLSVPGLVESGTGQAVCVADRWLAGERALLFSAGMPVTPSVAPGDPPRVQVSVSRSTYEIPDLRLGLIPLESAYVMANMHFFLPVPPAVSLPATCVAHPTDCANGMLTLTLASSRSP
jgi:hypothetical protein